MLKNIFRFYGQNTQGDKRGGLSPKVVFTNPLKNVHKNTGTPLSTQVCRWIKNLTNRKKKNNHNNHPANPTSTNQITQNQYKIILAMLFKIVAYDKIDAQSKIISFQTPKTES